MEKWFQNPEGIMKLNSNYSEVNNTAHLLSYMIKQTLVVVHLSYKSAGDGHSIG